MIQINTNLKITDNFIHYYIDKVELKQLEYIYFQIGCGMNINVHDVLTKKKRCHTEPFFGTILRTFLGSKN